MVSRSNAAIARAQVIPESDPLWQALMRAPIDHGPVPEEERLAVEEASKGPFLDDETARARLAARRP
ncbi:MAG: hypothetical protein U0359_27530 [Byssovorax sp.]